MKRAQWPSLATAKRRFYLRREGARKHRLNADPALVLLDLKLPKVDGLAVLHEIRRPPSTSSLPVVALTSSREPRDLRRCYEQGVNAYLGAYEFQRIF
ncbi:response regulator [Caballeronia temeraria]|uniref:response regulator n=1 Tax=Caballeronia temeraria TaxID=1777137 RepID=UPI000B2CEEFB